MEKIFLATISNHRILGNIILPYAVMKKDGQEFYSVVNRVTLNELKEYKSGIPEGFEELVKITAKYDENEIVKVFSKKKQSSADFFKSVDNQIIDNHIKPYVESKLVTCIDLIKEYKIPLYFKDLVHNIHFEDKVDIVNTMAETVFHFIKEKEGTKYFLSIKNGLKNIVLTDKAGLILVNDPCRLILEKKLFLFNDIDAKKLLPFFTKKYIPVTKSAEKKYFETFVRNSIRDYTVEAEGFEINYILQPPKACISIENDLHGQPSMLLKFLYDFQLEYYANKSSAPKVIFKEEKGNYQFYKIIRDKKQEDEYCLLLKNLELENRNNSYFYLSKPNYSYYDLINWICEHDLLLKTKKIIIDQSAYKDKYNLHEIKLDINVKEENDWFDIHGIVLIGDYKIPFLKFRKNILKNIREYELPDGKIAILPEEWFEKYRDLFLFSIKDEKNLRIRNYHANMLDNNITLPHNKIQENLEKLKLTDHLDNVTLPNGLKAVLRPYQYVGYHYMLQTGESKLGVCLADDMGLGKTLQTLAVLLQRIQRNENIIEKIIPANQPKQLSLFSDNDVTKIKERQASLIVMPSSLIHNWYNEIQKFTPDFKIYIYTGSNRNKDICIFGQYDILLTTYGTLRMDVEILKQYPFFYLILDESQVIKNFSSKTYKAAIELKSKYKLVLTGTPIENSLSDLWAQLHFLNRGLLGNYHFFREEFLVPIEKMKDEQKQLKLKRLIQPFILRRTKQEVASDLPELTEQTIFCDLTEEQENIYEKEKSKIRNSILQSIEMNGMEKSAFVVLQGLTKLRQLANHPLLVDENYENDSGKFEEVIRNLENLATENHKALIFSSFVKHLQLFENYFIEKGYGYSKLTGETREREEIIKKFQHDQNTKFFLISLKAGGVGLNLTAAEYVFMLDPWWNPAAENQAISRAHRIGQENKVFVYRFISNNTIEEKIQYLQQRKSKLAELFVNSNNPFDKMTEEEVIELFK